MGHGPVRFGAVKQGKEIIFIFKVKSSMVGLGEPMFGEVRYGLVRQGIHIHQVRSGKVGLSKVC